MDKYIVTSRVARLSGGVLHLTAEQAKHRAHNLKPLGKNRHEIINPVEFKAGEEIGYEGDLPKTLADNLTTKANAEAAAKKAAAEAEKSAKKAEAEAAKHRTKITGEAEAAWNKDATLREQHNNNFDAYLDAVMEQVG